MAEDRDVARPLEVHLAEAPGKAMVMIVGAPEAILAPGTQQPLWLWGRRPASEAYGARGRCPEGALPTALSAAKILRGVL